jgi:hypothetical protein
MLTALPKGRSRALFSQVDSGRHGLRGDSAAAFGTGKWYFADALWALTLLALVYVPTTAIFCQGRRRVLATSFLLASLFFVFCATFGSDALPTPRIIGAAGVGRNDSPQPFAPTYFAPQVWDMRVPPPDLTPHTDISVYVRAANAVATLAFGLLGSLVGLMAFSSSTKESGTLARVVHCRISENTNGAN